MSLNKYLEPITYEEDDLLPFRPLECLVTMPRTTYQQRILVEARQILLEQIAAHRSNPQTLVDDALQLSFWQGKLQLVEILLAGRKFVD